MPDALTPPYRNSLVLARSNFVDEINPNTNKTYCEVGQQARHHPKSRILISTSRAHTTFLAATLAPSIHSSPPHLQSTEQALNYGGLGPVAMAASKPSGWGPGYQTQAHAPGCPTVTFQVGAGAGGGRLRASVRASVRAGS